MAKMTKRIFTNIKLGIIPIANNLGLVIKSIKKSRKKKNKFPPQDTSTDIICGDPTEGYRN